MMEKIKELTSRAIAWFIGYCAFVVQMFRDSRPTEAEREADRQRREQERQKAEAQRQKQALDQWRATYLRNFSTYGVEILGRELFDVLQRIHGSLGVMRPLSAANLSVRIRRIAGFPWAVFEVRRLTLDPVDRDKKIQDERLIQNQTDVDVAAGLAWEVPPTFDGRTPSIICGPLAVVGETVYIPMALADYEAICRWWWSRRADQEHPKPPMDVDDGRF